MLHAGGVARVVNSAFAPLVSSHSNAVFSHGLCPACADRLYPDVGEPAGG